MYQRSAYTSLDTTSYIYMDIWRSAETIETVPDQCCTHVRFSFLA
jgi:hypothetical protein